ncbi:MAG: CYTH domain-containing protein [Gemmatimonadaceae bacterium]
MTIVEVELKSVVDDVDVRRRRVEAAGGALRFAGRLEDRRYDTTERALRLRDHVLRVRVRRPTGDGSVRATVDWKGPTSKADGYKVREELAVGVDDPPAFAALLARLGYCVTEAIDRDIWEYELDGATIRFERYPRMDTLVEVEGSPAAIERAVAATGLPRDGFTADGLSEFVRRFEARTGARAALSDASPGGGRDGADP